MSDTNPSVNEVKNLLPQSMAFMNDTMRKFLDTASVEAVYGDPVRSGETLIIPAAEVVSAMGFGLGAGSGYNEGGQEEAGETDEAESEAKEASQPANAGGGMGGGGGGRAFSRPVAVIIASPEGVRVEPVVDVTKIALAFFTALGFMIGMVARMQSRDARRAIEECCE